jgi:hypothetical protein
VQRAFAILERDLTDTVAKAMEKRGQIPAKPNSAPKADVDRVKARVEGLGLDWHDAVKSAGLSYATGYRFLKYEGSVGKLRELEEWVAREEVRKKRPPLPTAVEQDQRLADWLELGQQLAEVDPQHFQRVLEGLKDVLEASKLTQNAFRKMLRVTPDADR